MVIETNEIAEVTFQMPDTIDDLTKWDMFFSARIPLYKKLLKGVKSWEEASEEEKRILRRAQEEAENLIDIHVVMGEIYKHLPSDNGGRPEKTTVITDGSFTQKQQYKEKTGLSDVKARRFASMSDNPEIVAEVKAEARENNEIATQTEILRRIEEAKKEERARLSSKIQELERDNREQKDYIAELENREPEIKEVIKEVVPDDYKDLKKKANAYKSDLEREQHKVDEKQKKILELQDQIRALQEQTIREQTHNDLLGGVAYFIAQCGSFIQSVGGYVWIADKLAEIPERDREGYIRAANAVYSWASVLLENIRKDEEYGKPEILRIDCESGEE